MARILVVDDRADNRDLMSYLLAYYGHHVSTAPDGAAGVRAAVAERPDLILMDINMPGMDGFTAARLMRSEPALAKTPLLAISAGPVTTEMAQAAGFDAFYPLPIDPRDFVTRLEPFLMPVRIAEGAAQGEL
jgi:two-component system cell cycle response regulator DivK